LLPCFTSFPLRHFLQLSICQKKSKKCLDVKKQNPKTKIPSHKSSSRIVPQISNEFLPYATSKTISCTYLICNPFSSALEIQHHHPAQETGRVKWMYYITRDQHVRHHDACSSIQKPQTRAHLRPHPRWNASAWACILPNDLSYVHQSTTVALSQQALPPATIQKSQKNTN
jgi:hypothetical protein